MAPETSFTATIRFRPLAHAHLILFVVGLGFGALFTMTMSGWNADEDKVMRFYEAFNPCLLFDWWPAKGVVAPFWNAMMWVDMLYFVLILLYLVARQAPPTMLVASGIMCTIMLVSSAAFMNIGVTALYPEHHGHSHRRLEHPLLADSTNVTNGTGANGTNPLTEADIDVLGLHTGFYIQWLLAHAAAMVFVWFVAREINGYPSGAAFAGRYRVHRYALRALYVFGMLAQWMAALGMLLIVNHRTSNWVAVYGYSTFVQELVVAFCRAIKPELWHFLPLFCYLYLIRREAGVSFTFSLTPPSKGAWHVTPERTISWVFGVFLIMLFHGYLFENPSDLMDDPADAPFNPLVVTGSIVANAQFKYLFAPLILLCGFALAIAVALALARERLLHTSTRALVTSLAGGAQMAVGVMLMIAFLLQTEITFLELSSAGKQAIFALMITLLAIWLLTQAIRQPALWRLDHPLDGKVDETPFAKAWDLYARASQMIFVAVLLILLLVANFSLPAAVVLFAWLAAYALVVPPEVQTPLYITISTPSPPAEPAAIWYCGGGCGCDGIRVVKSESAAAPAAAEPGATEPAAAAL